MHSMAPNTGSGISNGPCTGTGIGTGAQALMHTGADVQRGGAGGPVWQLECRHVQGGHQVGLCRWNTAGARLTESAG
eukprot:760091-Pelagomonas_calceolata.AAC.2